MRTIRALMVALAAVVALPVLASAQAGRGFKDSWFWGIKAGGFSFADSAQNYKQAPMAGVEWLITRTHGGLYIAGGQAFLNSATITLRDANAGLDSGYRRISLKNLRKLDVALMAFPGEHIRFHPYVGAGFSLNEVASAVADGPYGNAEQANFAAQVIQDQKVGFSPMAIFGAQYRLTKFSVFGQGIISPAQSNFLLYNGRPYNFSYEVGLRYNVGSSINRQ